MRRALTVPTLALATLLTACSDASESSPAELAPDVSFEETLLATIPAEYGEEVLATVVFSPDGRTVAYWAEEDGEQFVLIDGEAGPRYEEVFTPTLGPGGEVAYRVSHERKVFVVRDGVEGPTFGDVWGRSLVFGPDGEHLAYKATDGEGSFMVHDGVEGPTFDPVWHPAVFSEDGAVMAYSATRDEELAVIVDGEPGAWFDWIAPIYAYWSQFRLAVERPGALTFRPGTHEPAYVGFREGDGAWAVVGDTLLGPYDRVGGVTVCFGGHAGFFDETSGLKFATQMDVTLSSGRDECVSPRPTLHFSEDGARVAFGARIGRELWWKVADLR
jgi:hypothetical protein